MSKKTAVPISDVLQTVVAGLNRTKSGDFAKITAAWKTAAGPKLARHARPRSFQRAVLVVGVDESAWLYQASLEKERILKALNEKISGEKKISDIQFKIGQIK